MKRWAVIALVMAAACGGEAPAPPAAKAQTPVTEAPAAAPQGVYAEMTTVDLEGKPLPGMLPIATLNPNAFDRPLASGTPTDANGHSAFLVPPGQRVFVRAWDPELKYFPNNFYEIPASESARTTPMTISMVAAAQIEARLVDAQGRPVANTVVELMLSHPTQGPWWPAQARTDLAGQATFAPVPPGEYTLQFQAQGVGQAALPKTFLAPAKTTPLGDVAVR